MLSTRDILIALTTFALVVVSFGWFATGRASQQQIRELQTELNTHRRAQATIRQEAKFLPLVEGIAGTPIADYPRILELASTQTIGREELVMLSERLLKSNAVHDQVPDLESRVADSDSIEVYTVDLNHPENPTGHDFLLAYVKNGQVLLCYRSVDYTLW